MSSVALAAPQVSEISGAAVIAAPDSVEETRANLEMTVEKLRQLSANILESKGHYESLNTEFRSGAGEEWCQSALSKIDELYAKKGAYQNEKNALNEEFISKIHRAVYSRVNKSIENSFNDKMNEIDRNMGFYGSLSILYSKVLRARHANNRREACCAIL